MYADSIVEERLALAKEELGWPLEYHDTYEVDKFTAELAKSERYNAAGQLAFTRDLTPKEFRFITNEKFLCACDAAYALTRYMHLADETDRNVRFKFRDTQKIYFNVVAELEAEHSAIELIIAKGRQQFVTTITELLIACRVFFCNDVNALVASADRTKSEEMGRKVFYAYDNLPWWIRPKYSRRVESVPGLLEFDTINTRISVQHGSGTTKQKGAQKIGLGRGGTRTVWHVSEASIIPKPEQQIEAALLRSVHPSPRVFGVVESTFAGKTGWFAENYKFSKEHRDDGMARLIPIFFSWPCAHDIYPMPGWIDNHPIPYEWEPTGKVLEQITKAELFIRTDPLLSKHFGKDWTMPMDQQWFYNVGYLAAERTGTLSTWKQEMCCDDVEAMVSSYDNVFGKEVIEVCHAERERKYDVYAITGQSIEERFDPDPDDIDYNLPRVPIIHKSHRGDTYRWELVPLRYDLYADATGDETELDVADAKLFIFKQPKFRSKIDDGGMVGREFGIGVDSSTGSGSDASVISVTQKGVGAIPDVQAAELRSKRIGHVEVFAFAMPISLYFKDPTRDILGYPMVGIEQIVSVGDVCQKEMKRLGYPAGRFFNFGRYDTRKIKSETNKQGWFTTGWSRPILIGMFVHCVKNGWYILNSPWTIEECREFEVHLTTTRKEKWEHSEEACDDGIFGSAISTFILHDLDTLADRSKKRFRAVGEAPPPVDIGEYRGMVVNPRMDIVKGGRILSIDDVIRSGGQLSRFEH
jgi:hypothetical protein